MMTSATDHARHDTAAEVLPVHAARILVLRTAQVREVCRAIGLLRQRYPGARFGVLGAQLRQLGAFDGCEMFEVADAWVTPRSVRPHTPALKAFDPDLVVLCLNGDWVLGYQRVSQVIRRLRARYAVVFGYDGQWAPWTHAVFAGANPVVRWLCDAGLVVLYPLVAVYLLAKPARPVYRGPTIHPQAEPRP